MTVSDQIINVLDSICDKFGIAFDWTQENVLPYLQELSGKLVKMEIATSIVNCILPFMILVAVFIFSFKMHKKAMGTSCYPYDFDEPAPWFATFGWIITGVMLLVTILIFNTEIKDVITCLTFPEKILLEYLQKLLK